MRLRVACVRRRCVCRGVARSRCVCCGAFGPFGEDCASESPSGGRPMPDPNPKGRHAPTAGRLHMHQHTTCLSPTDLPVRETCWRSRGSTARRSLCKPLTENASQDENYLRQMSKITRRKSLHLTDTRQHENCENTTSARNSTKQPERASRNQAQNGVVHNRGTKTTFSKTVHDAIRTKKTENSQPSPGGNETLRRTMNNAAQTQTRRPGGTSDHTEENLDGRTRRARRVTLRQAVYQSRRRPTIATLTAPRETLRIAAQLWCARSLP